MKIEKLPSGSYRIRKNYKGKTYTVIFDHKPTQKEAMQAMAAKLDKVKENHKSMTFQVAAEAYIESKRNILSPTTIRGYNAAIKSISDKLNHQNVYDITVLDVQAEINRMAKERSPKTVRNYHGFISAVLGTFCPNLKISTTLPQKIKNEQYIHSDEDIKQISAYAKATEYEIPLALACYGLRRSEICALKPGDIAGNTVRINKAKVLNENREWVEKSTKTTASTREVVIPARIADMIQKRGYVYKGHPNSITRYLEATEDALGIPHFPMHKLRHYFASKMSAMNIPEANIMKMGGWETDYVMKNVYRHAMEDKDKQEQKVAAERLEHVIFSKNQ